MKGFEAIVVDTTSAGPVYTQRPRNNTRAVMMRDPDGFVFEFVEPGTPPQTDVPANRNIYNARSSLALENIEKSLAFYGDMLGFTRWACPTTSTTPCLPSRARRAPTRGRPAPCRPARTTCGCSGNFETSRARSAPERAGSRRVRAVARGRESPGAARQNETRGVTVETPGGEPIALGGGARGVLVRSPDGLLIELVEPASSQAAR